ncbi:MAG TPA: ParB/RepB/Spo0J family partition protein [Bacteroidales bacterium]|nr:ParB/RepB/Spo0J family partition protein [Bacteroidales bacterium]HPT01134.1 ParB/RepB/Spo0J family partition protein [Bacteroidales bacterium]
MNTVKKKALGRGLSAILESPETDITSKDISGNYVAGAIANIPIDKIEANPFQPRGEFDEEALADLMESIREQGIIQPLTIRKMGFDQYQLISGERRLRAAKLAGLETIPAYIRVANDEQMLEWALIENIQRENLNAIEIAISYSRLIDECDLTQEELSKRVGKNRTTISNYMRLLKLPAEVQAALRDGQISMGHARSIISVEDPLKQIAITRKINQDELSVRDVEKLVKHLDTLDGKPARPVKPEKTELPEKYNAVKQQLQERFSNKAELKRDAKGKGSIVIPFTSDSDLEKIISILGL